MGQLTLLISDEENAIADFENLFLTFNMVRLTCRSEKGLDRYERLKVKFLDDGGWGDLWLPGGAKRIAWEGGTAENDMTDDEGLEADD